MFNIWNTLKIIGTPSLSTSFNIARSLVCRTAHGEKGWGPATLWQRYATWDMGRSCISQLLHDGSVMARIDSTEVRVRTTHSVPAAWMHLEIIWKSSGCIALQIWPSAAPCGFDGEMHLESRRRIRGVFESCSELAKRTQTASNFQRDAHARETHSKFL